MPGAGHRFWRSFKSRILLPLHARRTLSFAHALSCALSRPQRVYIGNLDPSVQKEELTEFTMTAEATTVLAAKHADEFLPYGEMYQLKEEMAAKAAK